MTEPSKELKDFRQVTDKGEDFHKFLIFDLKSVDYFVTAVHLISTANSELASRLSCMQRGMEMAYSNDPKGAQRLLEKFKCRTDKMAESIAKYERCEK